MTDTGKVSFQKLGLGLLLLALIAGYQNADKIVDFVKEINRINSNESYALAQKDIRKERFDDDIKIQSQRVYSIINPDMVGVWIYKPENLHHFRVLAHYEGSLPEGTTPEDFQNLGVDKTSKEYLEHISGLPYQSNGLDHAVSSITNTRYFAYSCPIFNTNGAYYGILGMYWKEMPEIDEKKFFVACTQAARVMGRNK